MCKKCGKYWFDDEEAKQCQNVFCKVKNKMKFDKKQGRKVNIRFTTEKFRELYCGYCGSSWHSNTEDSQCCMFCGKEDGVFSTERIKKEVIK